MFTWIFLINLHHLIAYRCRETTSSLAIFQTIINVGNQLLIMNHTKSTVLLLADPPRWNFITSQNPTFCNPPLYITVTYKQIMQFKTILDLGCPNLV